MSIPEGYTAAEWNNLSPEEQTALTDVAEDVGDVNGKAPTEDVDTVDDAKDAKTDDVKAESDTADGVVGDGDKKQADTDENTTAGNSSDNEKDNDRSVFVPTYHAAPVPDYAEKIAALDQKFEDGEVSLKEYNKERDELVRAQTKAEISAEQIEQVEKQIWQREIADFIEDNPEYKGKMRNAALDIAVKDLAAKPENADKSGRWFLREAHKVVVAELGSAAKNEKAEDRKPDDKPAVEKPSGDKKPSRKPDLSVVPTTLSNVPAADSSEASGGEFAHLDKLEGLALERALARLPKEKQDQYLAA